MRRPVTFGLVLEGYRKDCVGVMDNCDHDVLVAAARFDGEASCLVHGDFSGRLWYFDCSEDHLVGSGAAR